MTPTEREALFDRIRDLMVDHDTGDILESMAAVRDEYAESHRQQRYFKQANELVARDQEREAGILREAGKRINEGWKPAGERGKRDTNSNP